MYILIKINAVTHIIFRKTMHTMNSVNADNDESLVYILLKLRMLTTVLLNCTGDTRKLALSEWSHNIT
jgi:hypothetical protein